MFSPQHIHVHIEIQATLGCNKVFPSCRSDIRLHAPLWNKVKSLGEIPASAVKSYLTFIGKRRVLNMAGPTWKLNKCLQAIVKGWIIFLQPLNGLGFEIGRNVSFLGFTVTLLPDSLINLRVSVKNLNIRGWESSLGGFQGSIRIRPAGWDRYSTSVSSFIIQFWVQTIRIVPVLGMCSVL